jgi:hypothetical protein
MSHWNPGHVRVRLVSTTDFEAVRRLFYYCMVTARELLSTLLRIYHDHFYS